MPNSTPKKKRVSKTTKGYKVTKGSKSAVKSSKGIQHTRSKRQKATEKDGRMAAARKTATKKAVKKAGGTKAYLQKQKKTKAGLVKVGSVYRRKK